MSTRDPGEISSSYSTKSHFCANSTLGIEHFQELKNEVPFLENAELDSENGSLSITNVKTSPRYSLKLDKHLKVVNDKFTKNVGINETVRNQNSLDILSFDSKKMYDKKSIIELSRNIIRLLLGEKVLKKFDENNENFDDLKAEFYSQKFWNIFEFPNNQNKFDISCIHDSDLMCSFMFDEILGDFLVLTQYISQIRVNNKISTSFDTKNFKNISIRDYFMRLVKFSLCSPSLFIIMFIYIIRILEGNPSCVFDTKNAHRLMLSSLIICVKLYDDKLLTYSSFAQIGGVSNEELTRIETEALMQMNFKLKVDLEEFIQFIISIRIIGNYLRTLKPKNN
ncbi:cyclin 6 pcl7 [Cryptosporidium bovis]|uniref:cyclin 6 pcl7 n=1 Tax=Cryptosporidium bovis TaxID=310047 RepID=UPI00351A61B2|nr:cyclin 6 pcl7 [Cryptosporidium bovis]